MTPNRRAKMTPFRLFLERAGWPVSASTARAEGGVGQASELAVCLERARLRNGAFAAKDLAVLSDGTAWIRNVCEEVFTGRKAACAPDQFHALEYAAAAVQDLVPDKASGRRGRRGSSSN